MTRTFTNCSKILATLFIAVLCCWNVAYAQVETFDGETLCENTAFSPADNGDCPLVGTWSQDASDDFDFSVEADATPSGSTGPSVDHTQGDGVNGKFLFTEASGGANSTFTLNGPAAGYDLDALGAPAFQVWYHAFGTNVDIAELHLEVSTDGGTVYTSEFSIIGFTSEDLWKEATLLLTSFSGIVHLRVRVVTGGDFASDIGLDDVGVIDASAPDVALTGASAPISCGGDSETPVTITVTNNSATDVVAGELEATFEVTTGPVLSGPFTESLPAILSGESVDYTFTATADLSIPGDYTVDINVDFTAASGLVDNNPLDNGVVGAALSISESFGSIDGNSPAYVESFEAGDGGWTIVDVGTNPSSMVVGTPPTSPLDGTQAWFHDSSIAINAGESYNANELVFFETGCFDMSCMETATFSIDINFDSETNWDGATVGYNTDGGTEFTILGIEDGAGTGTSDGTGVNWYNDTDIDGIANEIDGWSGDCDDGATDCSGGWLTATHDISFLAGFPNVRFAVIFGSDGSFQLGEGFAWDNVQVTGDTTDPACLGCTDLAACNYDPVAVYDDGVTCEYTSCAGCTDETACNYDAEATIDDESCDFSCLGCTDVNACNYDDTATIDDGSCNLGFCGDGVCDLDCGEDIDDCIDCSGTVTGCTDETACNFDAAANTDDNSCEYVSCAGCTDETACNYNADATIDDSSCIYGSCGNGVCEPICGETDANCADCAIVLGCTDPDAHNYRPRANTDNGNCMTCDDGIQNGTETGIDCGGTNPNCDACPPDGCTDATAHNYDPNAPNDDGSCMTCSDGIQNGDETGVDCGGTNPECGPCGDLCINALEIACGDVMSGNTGDYTTADGPGACGTTPGIGGGVWYTFVGTGETFRASLCNSDYDTKINVYSGDCDNLVCVDGNDDTFSGACGSTRSSIDIVSTVGTTYYIYVNGFSTNTGNYELTFDCFFPITITVNAILGVPANGAGTGSVSITVTGGNTDCPEGLFFDWEDEDDNFVADTEDLSGLTEAGTYNIYVDDCLGNSVEMDVVVPTRGRTRGRGRNGKAEVTETSQLIATPNPFATETMIGFQVGMEESVSLDVFDIRGAKVATLFDGMAEAGQNYQMSFGEGMPSGTYIAKLTTANGDVQHIKLVLTK